MSFWLSLLTAGKGLFSLTIKLLIVVFDFSTQLLASISWKEGIFCAFWMLALESDFTMPQLDFLAKINDHGVHRDNTGWILAQWQLPMAFRVVIDLLYWAMRSALHRRIVTAIKMTSKGGAFICYSRFFVWLIVIVIVNKTNSVLHYCSL